MLIQETYMELGLYEQDTLSSLLDDFNVALVEAQASSAGDMIHAVWRSIVNFMKRIVDMIMRRKRAAPDEAAAAEKDATAPGEARMPDPVVMSDNVTNLVRVFEAIQKWAVQATSQLVNRDVAGLARARTEITLSIERFARPIPTTIVTPTGRASYRHRLGNVLDKAHDGWEKIEAIVDQTTGFVEKSNLRAAVPSVYSDVERTYLSLISTAMQAYRGILAAAMQADDNLANATE
jgi:hypothetical protein